MTSEYTDWRTIRSCANEFTLYFLWRSWRRLAKRLCPWQRLAKRLCPWRLSGTEQPTEHSSATALLFLSFDKFLVHVGVSMFSGNVFVNNQIPFLVELHVAFLDVTLGFFSVLKRCQDPSMFGVGFAFDGLSSDTHHEFSHGFAAS